MAKVREAASAKLKDGLPRKAFAYAPTADPATWALPYLTSAGAPDPDTLARATSALAEGSDAPATIPAVSLGMVKSKLRQAYRKMSGSAVTYPDSIKEVSAGLRESDDDVERISIREATILLDKGSVSAQVVAAPNGDMIVIPNWTGAFTDLAKAYGPLVNDDNWSSSYDAQDAAEIVSKLIRLKKSEQDEPEQAALIDTAIAALLKFIPAETAEMTADEDTCALCDHATDCTCNVCPCVAHGDIAEAASARIVGALIREAGKRNNTKDQTMVQSIHDMTHSLGAGHDMAYKAKYAEAEFDATTAQEQVTFREAGGVEYVTLAESSPLFDDATKTVWITPIKPGFGNKKDGFYYPPATLREATQAGMFTGLKMFRNHPRKSDEKDLPERSVTDWFAVTKESKWDEVAQEPRCKVQVFEDSDWNRFKAAPEQVAFSVLGGGTARPGRVDGQNARVMESLVQLRSVDWVTNAGAGGAIQFAESASEEFDMGLEDISKMTVEQVTALKESNPTIYDHLIALVKAIPETPAPTPDPAPAPAPAPNPEPIVVAESDSTSSARDQLINELLAERKVNQAERARVEASATAQAIVKAVLKESTLPTVAHVAIEEKFADATVGNGYIYTDEKGLSDAVTRDMAATQKLLQSVGRYTPRVSVGSGAPEPGTEKTAVREAVEARMASKWGTEIIPKPDALVILAGGQSDGRTSSLDGPLVPVAEAAQKVSDRLAAKWG